MVIKARGSTLIFIAVAAAMAGVLFLFIYSDWAWKSAAPNNLDRIIAAFSAIGTCAAAVIALWLSQMQTRRSHKEALERAQLYASGMSVQLLKTGRDLESAETLYGFEDASIENKDHQDHEFVRLVQLFSRVLYKPSHEELVAILPLPNQCAHRIARAYDIISKLRTDLTDSWEAKTFGYAAVHARQVWLDAWYRQVREAAELLLAASIQLDEASKSSATRPSLEELDRTPF
ncbi:hypothetical protein QRO11_09485 [Paracidovorax citrulli]|uniref:hypothetical protein n=1 Tax=Paracidovorax citrulli TaxID=80869 RepID=UPI00087E771C|nr:hypothetical protein [Paracidovorax citrulli]QCX12963.1 hypothetical protein APS58_4271 [Paracidovorax citrulli]UEG48014.1 hypothetical protein LKW27_09250 [Paracidovorax citrulli]UMT88741.1 hypothetical protein FRC90_12150 [Paracidovorax citrulli]UMT96715.1 hypothetical protein FRC97_17925 [Paracidovorax citrulli]WIY36527.1 hypothetical protein QRO11_09485 [Paracidovorax citrulli]